jgi:RNA polymerase sigma factor for flagellar operon FliA
MAQEVERVITAYQPLVKKLAARYRHLIDYDDLVALGNIGLWEAAQQWRPGEGKPFGMLAYFRVRAKMIDEIRAVNGRRAQRWNRTEPLPDDDGRSDPLYVERGFEEVEAAVDVEKIFQIFDDSEREIINALYFRGKTLVEFSAEQGISRHEARELRNRALEKARVYLENRQLEAENV